jgi:hypothetical protein
LVFFFSLLSGCYLVRPVKSKCLTRIRTANGTTTYRRAADKESKLTTIRTNIKNGNHLQRDDPAECHL